MIRKLNTALTAYCSPSSATVGAIVSLSGKCHRIQGISESGVVATQIIGESKGLIGRLSKDKSEITFDQEHDWEAKVVA